MTTTDDANERSGLTPSELVESVMKLEAQRTIERAPAPARTSQRIQLGLVFVALIVLAVNAVLLLRDEAAFTPTEQEAGIRLEIFLTAQVIDAWRDSTNSLPDNLMILGYDDDDDIIYTREGSGYVLTATVADRDLVYRSGHDLAPYSAAYQQFER